MNEDSHGRFDLPHVCVNLGYDFGKGWTMGSEIEFEHGGNGTAVEIEAEEAGEYEAEVEKGGEVNIEQFWINKEFMGGKLNIKAGEIIVPAGADRRAVPQVQDHPVDWTTGSIMLSAGSDDGGQRLRDYATDACATVAIAVIPCDDGDVRLFAVCPANSIKCVCVDMENKRRQAGAHHGTVTTPALSCRIPAHHRHLPRCRLGKRVVGQLLVVGP